MEVENSATVSSGESCLEDGIGALQENYILPRTRSIKKIDNAISEYNMVQICSPSFTGKTSLVICYLL